MLWKQKTLKTAHRGCVRLKHWIAHKWSWFHMSYFMALMSYLFPNENKQTKQNNFKMSKTNRIAPKYPQPQPNKYFPCLNKIPEKFSDINKGQPFSPELITLRAFPFSHTVFSILFFHVLHPACSSLLTSSGSKPWTLSLHLKDGHRFPFGPDSIAYTHRKTNTKCIKKGTPEKYQSTLTDLKSLCLFCITAF